MLRSSQLLQRIIIKPLSLSTTLHLEYKATPSSRRLSMFHRGIQSGHLYPLATRLPTSLLPTTRLARMVCPRCRCLVLGVLEHSSSHTIPNINYPKDHITSLRCHQPEHHIWIPRVGEASTAAARQWAHRLVKGDLTVLHLAEEVQVLLMRASVPDPPHHYHRLLRCQTTRPPRLQRQLYLLRGTRLLDFSLEK